MAGLATDQPALLTRVGYADASEVPTGAVSYAEYAPFSIVPLWDYRGRADRLVFGGTAAPGSTTLCVDPGTEYRCVYPGIDWGAFPYLGRGMDGYVWQGTVLPDKPDAAGTYYRRNRTYDPATARFTQEDPLGLGGGLNAYGFAAGDPIQYADPFGLKVCFVGSTPAEITTLTAALKVATQVEFSLGSPDASPLGKRCVENVKPAGDGFTELGSMFAALVGWAYEVDIMDLGSVPGIGSSTAFATPTGASVYINEADQGAPYLTDPSDPTHLDPESRGLRCGQKTARFSLPAVLTHEILGHAYSHALGWPINDEEEATYTENIYHAEASPPEPTRCRYK